MEPRPKITLALRHLFYVAYTCQKSLTSVDAFHCYKHKREVN